MKKLFLMLFFAGFYTSFNVPETKAFDPVTLAILAPYAMPYAEAAGQKAMKGLSNAGPAILDVFINMLSIFLLPLGAVEATLGAPFGYLGDGISDIGSGIAAPFKMVFSLLTIPIRMAGAM